VKVIRHSLFLIIVVVLIFPKNTLANWYAGAQRTVLVNGITALISTPSTPVNLIQSGSSG